MRQTSEIAADLLSVFRQRLWPQPQPRQRCGAHKVFAQLLLSPT